MTITFRAARARQPRHACIVRACDNAFLVGITAGATFIIIFHGLTGGTSLNSGERTANVLPFRAGASVERGGLGERCPNPAGLRLVAGGVR